MTRFVDHVNLDGNRVTNLADPSADTDATPRAWVVQAISAAIADAGGLDPEEVRAVVAAMLDGSPGITVDYDAGTGTVTIGVTDSPTVAGQTPAQLRDRATHTGSQPASTISDFDAAAIAATGGEYDPAGAAAAAQAHAVQRANHTGTQMSATISDFAQAVAAVIDGASIDADTLAGSTRTQIIAEAIAGVVDGAPEALDTLRELADALGEDPNFAATITTEIARRNKTYATTVGNGSDAELTVTHGLASRDVEVQVYEVATGEQVGATVRRTSPNAVTVGFALPPAAGQFRVVVQGRAESD